MPMEPDLYRALRAKDIRRVRECLRDWGNENKRVWWTGGVGGSLTPLHVASKGSSKDILMELLRHPEIGRSINTLTDKTNVTPLHEAAGSSSPEVVRLLLDAGADIASPSGDLSTAFHIACSRGRIETCVELLRRGSLLEGRDAEGMTPLLRAAANGRADVTKWLLSEGADPAAVDINKNTALALSCRATCLDPARALLDGGADIVAENSDGDSCVSIAAISGRTELLDMMLTAMATSGQRFRDGGGDMLYEVVDHGLAKVVELLTSARGRGLGVNVNRPNPLKQSTAPRPTVRSLLRAKADANIMDDFGCSPIYYSFVRGNDEIVRYMLSRGASLFRMDYDQALRIACFYGMVVEVEKLLWMEAEPSSVAFNHRDRGSAFHNSVNPAVRDGVNALLNESNGDSDSDGDGTDGSSARVALAKEAAAAWGAAAECMSPTGTLRSSTSTGTGWTSGGESSSRGDAGSSVASEKEGQQPAGGDGHESCSARVRQALGFLGRDGEDERKEEEYGSEDDDENDTESFVLPSLVSLENDLIREGDLGIF
ncbi:unnamed protein product, partial [Laminaria digitata]